MENGNSLNKKTLLLISLVLLIFGCTKPSPSATATIPVAIETPVVTVTNTALPGKLVLVGKAGFLGDADAIQAVIQEQAAASGLVFDQRDAIQPSDITPDWKVIFLLNAPDNLTDLLNQAPGARFIVVTGDNIAAANNLNVIHLDQSRLAFLAGYITELTSDDWRGAGLFPSDTPTANNELQAFVNGGQYWCGTCSPAHPPYVKFPIYTTQPVSSDWTAWQVAADQLIADRLSDIYVSRSALKPELLSYLAGKGIKLLGEGTPTQEVLGNWVTSISWNLSDLVKNNWTDLISDQTGQTYEAGLLLTNVNAEFLTLGKQRLVEEVAAGLQQGLISPLSVP